MDAFSIAVACAGSFAKLSLSRIHQSKIRYILNSIIDDWFCIGDGESRAVMLKYAYMGRMYFIIQMIGTSMGVIPLITTNLPSFKEIYNVQNESISVRNIPHGPNCWISLEISTSLYMTYYIFVCVALCMVGIIYIGTDAVIFGLAMHICGQFDLLRRSLQKINDENIHKVQREKLFLFFERHKQLLYLANKFEESFNFIIFFEIGGNALILIISGEHIINLEIFCKYKC